MVFKEIKHEQLFSFQNLGPMADLEIEKEKPKPPNIPVVKEPSNVEKPSSSQVQVNENIMTAMSAAWKNYLASGNDIQKYFVETGNKLYFLVPCMGDAQSMQSLPVQLYRQFDFSGTQGEKGMQLLIDNEKTFIETSNTNQIQGKGSAYGFDGATFDDLSAYMSAKGFKVKQTTDPWDNKVKINGMVNFTFKDGDERIKILEALREFKIDFKVDGKSIADIGSTPAEAYAVASKDQNVLLGVAPKGTSIETFLNSKEVTVSGGLPSFQKFPSDHWYAGQSYISFKGEREGEEQNFTVRKDKDGILYLEVGGEGGVLTDGTYISNTAKGGFKDRVLINSEEVRKIENAVLENQTIYSSKLNICPYRRPEQLTDVDLQFDAFIKKIDPDLIISSTGYASAPVTKEIKLTLDYSKAKLVTKDEYDKYLEATKTQDPQSWLASDGSKLSITGSATEFSATATGYIPFCADAPAGIAMMTRKQLIVGDPSVSMGGQANAQLLAFTNYSKAYNVGFQFLPYSGENVNIQSKGSLLNAPKENVIAALENLNIDDAILAAQLPKIDAMAQPKLMFTPCKWEDLKSNLSNSCGITLGKSELKGLSMLKTSGAGMPYLIERGSKAYSVHYSEKEGASVYEVPMVSFTRIGVTSDNQPCVNRYDVVNDSGGLCLYDRSIDFDNYKQFFQNTINSLDSKYDVYMPAEFGDLGFTQKEWVNITTKLKQKDIRVFAFGMPSNNDDKLKAMSAITSGTNGGWVNISNDKIADYISSTMLVNINAQLANVDLSAIKQVETPPVISLAVNKQELAETSTGTINVDNALLNK